MVLTPSPSHSITTTAAIRDSGIAARLMSVVLKFQRNRKSTTVTMTAPSARADWTFQTARRMKSACWKAFVSIRTSGGRVGARAARVSSMRRVTSRVLAWGCFWIVATTAGRPLKLPSPRL